MSKILIRAHKNPFQVADANETLSKNLIGNNTGNLVFSQAVFRLLSTQDNMLVTSGLIREAAGQVNSEYDHVVIPLANAFRLSFVDSLNAMSDLIEKLKVPVTVVGVGTQATIQGEARHSSEVDPATTRFVKAVLDRSPSIGVRGPFTQEYVRGLGFDDDQVQLIGCPSMFMDGPHLEVHKKVDALSAQSPIALNISPYVKAMGPISLDHAERYPRLVYMGQDDRTLELLLKGEYPMGERDSARTSGVPVTLDHPLISQDRVRFFLDPQAWFDELAQYDFSFGTRIHGNIAALLAGTPALVLAHDSRTLELADYHQIPHRALNKIAGRVDAAKLYAEADWEPLNRGHRARWDTFAAFLAAHELTHVFDKGQTADAFDDQLTATDFPPPVHTLMGLSPHELYALKKARAYWRAQHRRAVTRPLMSIVGSRSRLLAKKQLSKLRGHRA